MRYIFRSLLKYILVIQALTTILDIDASLLSEFTVSANTTDHPDRDTRGVRGSPGVGAFIRIGVRESNTGVIVLLTPYCDHIVAIHPVKDDISSWSDTQLHRLHGHYPL